jgi:hypothetical protein
MLHRCKNILGWDESLFHERLNQYASHFSSSQHGQPHTAT